MLFKELLGQNKLKELLMQLVREERVPHAQLFLGSKGSANLGLALAFAQYVAVQINSKAILVVPVLLV